MSIKIMSEVWDNAPYDGAQLLVLLALADHAGDDGQCFPSVARLAKRARCTQRWVQLTLREFIADGYVSREIRHGHSSLYTVHPSGSPDAILRSVPRRRAAGG